MTHRGRARVRALVAGTAALVGLLYLLIALDLITVVDDQGDRSPAPLFIAAGLFVALTAAMRYDRRAVYAAGAVLQVLVLVMYLAIASERTPAFEAWGIAIKVLQVGLLGALVLLILAPAGRVADGLVGGGGSATAQR